MKKVFSYVLVVLFASSFLFLDFNSQDQTKAAETSVPNPSVLGFISDIGQVNDVVVPEGSTKAYLASEEFGLVIVDVADKNNPKVLGSQHPVDKALYITISPEKNLAIVCKSTQSPNSNADIVDISDPAYPKVLSSVTGACGDAAFVGNYVYITSGGDIKVVNLTNPSDPQVVATLTTPGISFGIAVSGNTVVSSSAFPSSIQIINISNPTSPNIVGSLTLSGMPQKVALSGNSAFIANNNLAQMQVVDITTPSSPTLKGFISVSGIADVTASGTTAYASSSTGLKIINILDPASPTLISTYPGVISTASVSGNTAYLAKGILGMDLVNITNKSAPTLIKNIVNSTTGLHLAISTSRNLAIVAGTSRGTDIVDISNPTFPKVLSSIAGGSSDAVFINDNIVYIAAGDIKVVNISDPSNPQVVTTLVTPSIANGIAVSGNVAVVADFTSGMMVLNISNPTAPTIAGSLPLGGIAAKIAISGNLALVANSNLGRLQIIDITTPSNPLLSGFLGTGSSEDVTAVGNTAYLSANGNFKIIDISNPALPTLVSTYNRPTHTASVVGDYAFTTGERNGVDVVDISNKSNPTQKANIISVGNAKDVVVANGKIYVADEKAELVIMDIYHDTPTFKLTADKSEVSSGDEVTYTLTLTNPSPNTLTNLNLSDVVPTGTTYVTGSATGGGTYSSGKVTWPYASMTTNQTITERFSVKVK